MTINSKADFYCHAVPIIKGLEEAGENMDGTKAQIVVLGQMLEGGDITAEEAADALNRTFGHKAVEEAAKICVLHGDEVLADSQAMEDEIVACQPCLEEALKAIMGEQEEIEKSEEGGE